MINLTKRHRITVLLALFMAVTGYLLLMPSHTSALFNYTSYPMEDSVMRNNSTMSAMDIQVFLNNQGSGLASFSDIEDCGSPGGAHYSYYATYYACGARRSAAQIIYDAGQAYGINPQMVLATLQKEQSLITTPNPTVSQLNYAMGYGCPDSGGCSYPGFFNQVDNGTWQFRVDMELSSGNNYWGYSPASYPCNGPTRYYSATLKAGNNVTFYDDHGTGYTSFVIPNASTATLYCYTPHVYPGSAQQYYSGSYWFVYYYNKWFVPYSWSWGGQNLYTDANKTTAVDSYNQNLVPGQRYYAVVRAQNTGAATWTQGSFRLGTSNPINRNSAICDSTWINCGRPATLKESSVAPGQIGTFEFWIKAPPTNTNNKEYFTPLQENVAWLNDVGMNYTIKVNVNQSFSWAWGGQNVYTDSNKSTTVDSYNQNLIPGQRYYTVLKAKNTGNVTWTQGSLRLGTSNPLNHSSAICDSTWINCGRPATLTEASVAPGQTGTFEFWIKAPPYSTNSKEYFNLLQENVAWLNDLGMNYVVKTNVSQAFSWAWGGQNLYTDANKTTSVDSYNQNLTAGQKYYAVLKAKNTGTATWTQGSFRLGTSNPLNRSSAVCDSATWINCGRPATLTEASVAPGQTGTFEFWLKAPSTTTNSKEYFTPLQENVAWFNDLGMNYVVKVP